MRVIQLVRPGQELDGHLASLRCVDLRTVFGRAAEALARLRLNRFDHHASAYAHELAARALLDAFEPRWLAPSGAPAQPHARPQ